MLGNSNKKSKRAKNLTRINRFFYVKYAFVVLLIAAYYAYNFAEEQVYVGITQTLANITNITCSSEPYYWLALNT